MSSLWNLLLSQPNPIKYFCGLVSVFNNPEMQTALRSFSVRANGRNRLPARANNKQPLVVR
jgi:hypothetical protein